MYPRQTPTQACYSSDDCHCTNFDQLMTCHTRAIFLVYMHCVSIYRVQLALFLARIRWFSEQNLDAITTEAIRLRMERSVMLVLLYFESDMD